MRRHVHGDAVAMPKRAQLLQRLALLQRRGAERGKGAQKAGAVAVDADVAQRRRLRGQLRDALGKAVALPRQGRAA